ncbi:T9SS type B sorting domain-containing protein, partial [Flavobacterium sp.]|uniref:T9SS type B sorting domain-containing protein n=1 Tax=Flavobacterium sp. TaxID=239 RepID=UPI0026278D60
GQIAPSAVGGTGPYTFQYLTTGSPAPTAASPGWVATNPFLCESGTYDVYVKDAYGCIKMITVVVNLDATPIMNATINSACAAEGAFAINVTLPGAGIAPYTYIIDGSANTTLTAPFTISGLSSGSHSVQVQDFNGCGNTVILNILPPLGITPSVTALPSCANNEGQITVSATGGSGSYSYTLSNSVPVIIAGPQASNVFSGLAAGSYTVTVTDLTTLCTKNIAVVLSAPTPVTFTNTVTNTSCNGSSDGTITVNLTSAPDNPVYMYQITAPAGPWVGAPQTTNVFTGLPAGTYTVVVTPGRGCPVTNNNVVVGQPTVVTIQPIATVVFNCAPNNSVNTASFTITAFGGTPAYTYSIDGINYFPTNTFTISDTGATSLTVYVKDANGCLDTEVVTITPLPAITNAVVNQTTPITCVVNELVTIVVTGGSGNFSYQTLPIGAANVTQIGATNQFNISAPGTYYFQVNDLTTNCYFATLPYTVAPFNNITVVATPKAPVTCYSGTDGSIEIQLSGYSGTYSYDVYDSTPAIILSGTGNTTVANPQPIFGLPAGNYTVQVTETADPRCAITSNTVSVGSPTAQLTLIASESANVTCTNDQGIITALASGGWGTYEYELIAPLAADNVPFSSNNVFTGLSAGTYTVNVRDLLGCPVSVPVTLVNPGIINATFLAAPALLNCYGDTNATITATVVSGGQVGNYTYTLHSGNPIFASSGPQVSPVFTGLGAGTYTVSITDGYNCGITSAPIVISEPQPIQAQLNVTTGVTCFTQATLTLTAQGGTAPYGYSTNVGGPFIPFNAGNSTTISVPVGLYNYYVNDVNGCLGQSNNAQVDALQPLVFSTPSHTDILCPGSFGSISIAATGGLLNYVYTLYDTAGNPIVPAPTQTTPGNFTGLVAGSYIVHVLSGLDCTKDSAIITIAEPPTFVATPTPKDLKCNGVDDGSIHFDIVGGSGQFQYAIDPDIQQFFNIPSTGFDITGLGGPTTYHIIIRDGIHCPQEFDVFINEPAPVATTYGTHGNETCAELDDAYITINNITGGFAPYSVSYNLVGNTPSTPVVIPSFPYVIDNLNGGEYEITITDANGCPSYPPSVILDGGILYDPLAVPTFMCDANKKPMVIIKIINLSNPPSFNFVPAADYMFSIDDSVNAQQTSPIFSSADWPNLLTPGTHIGYVFTATCPKETPPITVNPADVNQLTLTLTHVELNQIIADVNNSGTAPYNYTFNGHDNGSNPIYVYDHAGTYHVIVTDSRDGCSAEADILVPFTPIFIPPVFTPDGNGEHDTWSPENTSNYKNLKTLIYDRYGRKVAELSEGQGWDGKYNEKELPTGDYWYVIKVDGNEDQEFVGHFTLYR